MAGGFGFGLLFSLEPPRGYSWSLDFFFPRARLQAPLQLPAQPPQSTLWSVTVSLATPITSV